MSNIINQGDMSCNHYCRDIDNELLIQEVKARPAIYNRSVKEYNDQPFKRAMWEEISAKLYHEIWDDMNETQKEAKGAEIVKRWNNLRTCFSRELKIMRDPLQNKRRKYIYFDKLLFLLDEIRPDLTTVKEHEPTFVFSNSSFEQEDEHEQSPILKKTLEKKSSGKSKTKNRDFEKYVQSSINKLREEFAMKARREHSVESVPKTFDTDADSNFALSLVPMLRMIPIDKKIDAQIDLLNVLKKYTIRNTYDYSIVKFEREDEQSEPDDNSEILSYFGEEK